MPERLNHCIICRSLSFNKDNKSTCYLNLAAPFNNVKCQNCSFRWLNPRPTKDEYNQVYSAAYFDNDLKEATYTGLAAEYPPFTTNYTGVAESRIGWFKARLDRIKNLKVDAKNIIDIGVGTGEFLDVAKNDGLETFGIELSIFAAQKARNNLGLDIECCNLDSYDSNGKLFDLVHLSHVFEHFLDPVNALNKIKRIIAPTGLLIIEVPNQFNSPVNWIADLRQWQFKQPRSLHSIHHPFFYTAKHLKLILENNGFNVLSLKTYFPERYNNSISQQVLSLVDRLSDRLAKQGRNIEAIAYLKETK